MSDFAIIETSGKQYIVKPGDTILTDDIKDKDSKTIEFDKVLFVFKKGKAEIGSPYIKEYVVKAEVNNLVKASKITTSKFKAKSRYTKKTENRQSLLEVTVKSI